MKKKRGGSAGRGLTSKQLKFIELYGGNGTEAARLAGYAGDDATLATVAYENMRKPEIRAAIKRRGRAELEPLIATRKARQKFWAKVMMNADTRMADRLKASELLGKSEADFTDIVKTTGETKHVVVIASEEQLAQAVKKEKDDC